MKYSSVRRPPMCLYSVHILQPTPHKHLKKGLKISFQVTPLLKTYRRVRSTDGQSDQFPTLEKIQSLKERRQPINVNEGATNTICLKKRYLKCYMRKCLKILGGDPLQIAGKRQTIFTPHLSLAMSVAHPKQETQTNLTSILVYPPLLHVTHTSRYPSKGADTNPR